MRTPISTPKAPKAIGPYSQAILAGNLLFSSGQIPIDPSTGELVDGGIMIQTERVLENIKAILEASGASLGDVLKATIFLIDLQDFAAVNSVYARYFPLDPPARSTVQVAALPKGSHIEIEVIARVPERPYLNE